MTPEDNARSIVKKMGCNWEDLDDADRAVLIVNIHIMKYGKCVFTPEIRQKYADGEYVPEHQVRTPYHYDYLNKRLQQIWNRLRSAGKVVA